MSDYLPQEILFQIFLNLPAKTLLRFLLVCKSWYAIITSKPFVSSHLIQNPNCENNSFSLFKLLNVHSEDKDEEFLFYLDNETENQETACSLGIPSSIMYPPLVASVGFNRIVGIENGLICLIDDFAHASNPDPFLWNPAIGVFITLPRPEISRECPDMYALGFWFDSVNNDFRVMRIVYRANKREDATYHLPPLAEVYSVNMAEWRKINVDGVKCYMPYNSWSHAYVNGRSHWIGYRCDPLRSLIMSFDMNGEVFGEILLPPKLASTIAFDVKITQTMGCLVVIGDDRRRGFCRIWVMKEYGVFDSWTNLCDIPIDGGPNDYKFLGFWKNSDVLLMRDYYQLVRYVPGSESFVDLDINGQEFSMYVGKYQESLALLDLQGEWMEEEIETTKLIEGVEYLKQVESMNC